MIFVTFSVFFYILQLQVKKNLPVEKGLYYKLPEVQFDCAGGAAGRGPRGRSGGSGGQPPQFFGNQESIKFFLT